MNPTISPSKYGWLVNRRSVGMRKTLVRGTLEPCGCERRSRHKPLARRLGGRRRAGFALRVAARQLLPRLLRRDRLEFTFGALAREEVVVRYNDEEEVDHEERAEEDNQQEERDCHERLRPLQHVHQVGPTFEGDCLEHVGHRVENSVEAGDTAVGVGLRITAQFALFAQRVAAAPPRLDRSQRAARAHGTWLVVGSGRVTAVVQPAGEELDADDAEGEQEEGEEGKHVEHIRQRCEEGAHQDTHAFDALHRAQRPQHADRAQRGRFPASGSRASHATPTVSASSQFHASRKYVVLLSNASPIATILRQHSVVNRTVNVSSADCDHAGCTRRDTRKSARHSARARAPSTHGRQSARACCAANGSFIAMRTQLPTMSASTRLRRDGGSQLAGNHLLHLPLSHLYRACQTATRRRCGWPICAPDEPRRGGRRRGPGRSASSPRTPGPTALEASRPRPACPQLDERCITKPCRNACDAHASEVGEERAVGVRYALLSTFEQFQSPSPESRNVCLQAYRSSYTGLRSQP